MLAVPGTAAVLFRSGQCMEYGRPSIYKITLSEVKCEKTLPVVRLFRFHGGAGCQTRFEISKRAPSDNRAPATTTQSPDCSWANPTGSRAYDKTGRSDPPCFGRHHEEMASASRQRAGVHSVSQRRDPVPAERNFEIPRGLHGPAVTGASAFQSNRTPSLWRHNPYVAFERQAPGIWPQS